ncbi:MAG: DUF4337 family protein [bacterium]
MAEEKNEDKRFEIICGLLLAIFAAVLAFNELGAGKFGADELASYNEKASAYAWYNSKSIKENLADGQKDILQSLIEAGSIKADQEVAIKKTIDKLETKVEKYGKEKNEILFGSKKVGKDNWVQDVGGKMGKVIGAEEWGEKSQVLGAIGDSFDLGTLFLQIGLVFGAISLVLQVGQFKWVALTGMVFMCSIGSFFTVISFMKGFGL